MDNLTNNITTSSASQSLLQQAKKLQEEISEFAASIGATQKKVVPDAQSTTAINDADVLQKKINQRNEAKMDFFNAGPLFAKPAFYLDSYAPMLNVVLILDMNQSDNPKCRIEIFNNSSNPTNNHVKNFSASYNGRDGAPCNFTLGLVDLDSKLTDMLMYQCVALSVQGLIPFLEIEYGWSCPQPIILVSGRKPKFTKKIYCVLGNGQDGSGISVQINQNGTTDMTLTGGIINDPPVTINQLPSAFLGLNPGINLTAYYVYNIMLNILDGSVIGKVSDYDNNIDALITELYLLFFKIHKFQHNQISFLQILISMISYFRSTNEINNNFFPYNIKDLKTSGTDKDVDYTIQKINSRIEPIFKRAANQDIKNCKSLKFSIISDATVINDFVSNVITKSFMDIRLSDAGHDVANTDLKVAKLFTIFFQSIAPFVSEMLIHPFYVWNYCWETFDLSLKTIKGKVIMLDDGLLGDNALQALTSDKSDVSAWDTLTFDTTKYKDQNIGSVLPSCEKALDITDDDHREKYMHQALTFNIGNNSNWDDLFKNIGEKIKVNYYVDSPFEASLIGAELKDNQTKKNEPLMVKPMSIYTHLVFAPKKAAQETLDTYKETLNTRKKIMSNLKNFNQGLIDKMNKNIDAQLSSLGLMQSYIDGSDNNFFYICYRNVMSLDTIMSEDINATKILQCYSTRPYKDKFNSGEESCWDVNFPDVLEFGIEGYNPSQVVATLRSITKMSGESKNFQDVSLDNLGKQLTELRAKFEEAKGKDDTYKKDWCNESSGLLSTLESQLNDFDLNQERMLHPHKFKIGHYGDSIVSDDTVTGIVGRTKQVQEMRYMIATAVSILNANLKVIGDPSFNINHPGNYVFVKHINNDGGMGYFTGIYNIHSIKDEISAGSFTTTFGLMLSPILNGSYPDLSKTFLQKIYNEGQGVYASTNGMIKKAPTA